jgi:hypothetical protein
MDEPTAPEGLRTFAVPSVYGGAPQQPVQAEPQEEAEEEPGTFEKIADFFTGHLRGTKEAEGLSELALTRGVTSGKFLDDLKGAAALVFVADDEAKKDILTKNLPGIKFHEDKKGTTIIELPDGRRAVLNKPGLSYQDFAETIGQLAAFFGASKVAGLGKTVTQKAAIGGGAAAATEYGLQKAAQELGSEQPVDPSRVTLAGTLGSLGETLVPAVKGVTSKIRASRAGVEEAGEQATREALKSARQAEQVTKETGIPFFKAQKTLDPASLEKQSYLPTLSAGSKKAATELKKQNEAAYNAVEEVLDSIAPAKALETGPSRLKSAATKAVEARKTARAEKASPLYDEAFSDETVFDVAKTLKTTNEIKGNYPKTGEISKQVRKVESLIKGKANIKKLHGAKTEIDDMVAKAVREGDNNQAREMLKIKESLLQEMDNASPAYREAREIYKANSPAVQELEESIIGKISAMDETQKKRIASRLFDPTETNPTIIRNSKKVIDDIDPGAWNEIVRTELERRIGTVSADLAESGATVENVPGQLYRSIFGNTKQRKVLYSGLDKETAKNVRYLEEGLKRASKGRPGGSQTATREQIKAELRGGIGAKVRSMFAGPLKTLSEAGEASAFDRRARAMTEAMFNPKWKPEWKKLRKLDPNSKRAASLFDQIMKKAEKGLEDITPAATQLAKPEEE